MADLHGAAFEKMKRLFGGSLEKLANLALTPVRAVQVDIRLTLG